MHDARRVTSAGLPIEGLDCFLCHVVSSTSFRHGGLTETRDAEPTDREILSRHTTVKVLPKYVRRATKQIATGTKK